MLNTNNTHIAQQQQQQQQASVYDDPYLFACGGSEGFALLTYSPKNHQCQKISSHRPHGDNRVNTLSWNHNNKVLLSGGEDQTVAMTIADGLKSLGNLRDFVSCFFQIIVVCLCFACHACEIWADTCNMCE